jgi:CubicO group peptidase (beta-lactamase class C family)
MVALAVLSLAAASCSPRRGSPIRSATGITSHTVCAAAFLQKVDPDEAYREAVSALPGFWSIRWALKYEIDPVHREVRSQVAGGFESRAVYRDGVGCLIVQRPEDAAPALAPDQIPADAPQGTDLGPLHPVDPVNPGLKAALDDAFAEPEGHPFRYTKAVIVAQDGKIVAERYAAGIGLDTPLPGWSMSKSVTSALIGVLVREGKLSVQQPAPVAPWRDAGDPRHAITVDMLLRQTSGLALEETGSGWDPNSRMLFRERDMSGFAEAAPLDAPPGRDWRYQSGNAQILSRFIRDSAGGDTAGTLAFARKELFAPLGIQHMTMEFDATGTPVGPSYFYAPARDWVRFGLLYLNDGMAQGKRILPEGWADYSASATPQAEFGYGAGWWTNRGSARFALRRVAAGMPADSYFASGALGQRLIIVPSERLVILRMGLTQDWPDFDIQGAIRLTREVVAAIHTPPKS